MSFQLDSDGRLLALCLLQLVFFSILTTVILLVPRNGNATRFLTALALAALTYLTQQKYLEWSQNPHWRAAGAALLWVQFMSASELTAISRVSLSDFPSTWEGKQPKPLPIRHEVIRVAFLVWNLRRIGTPWQVKNTPPSSRQSRATFIRQRLLSTLLAYLILDIMLCGPAPTPALISRPKQALWKFQAFSLDDVIFQTIATVSFWSSTALLLLVMGNCAAIVAVLSGWCSPHDCPPLFGSIVAAYSIRQFWGTTWHQCLRRGLTGHADLIVDSVFRMPRGNALSRYTRLLLAFLVSGFIHYSADMAMGVPRSEAGAPTFFTLQALGIMFEDMAQCLTAKWRPRNKTLTRTKMLAGRVWVLVFLAWSTPTWFYPWQRLAIDPTRLLPIRIVPALASAYHNP